jgi:hypothetical protein
MEDKDVAMIVGGGDVESQELQPVALRRPAGVVTENCDTTVIIAIAHPVGAAVGNPSPPMPSSDAGDATSPIGLIPSRPVVPHLAPPPPATQYAEETSCNCKIITLVSIVVVVTVIVLVLGAIGRASFREGEDYYTITDPSGDIAPSDDDDSCRYVTCPVDRCGTDYGKHSSGVFVVLPDQNLHFVLF